MARGGNLNNIDVSIISFVMLNFRSKYIWLLLLTIANTIVPYLVKNNLFKKTYRAG